MSYATTASCPSGATRPLRRPELDTLIAWARDEGWNPGLHDAEAFHAADPQGFLATWQDGRPIAGISAVRYGDTFGFIGLYIVPPAFRGQGHGHAIWKVAMEQLRGRLVGLDGVPAQQDNYRRSGFHLAHRNIRYQGPLGTLAAAPPPGSRLVPATELPLTMLAAYDRAFFPVPRAAFLQHWLRQPAVRALALMRGPELCGYGVIRPCHEGYKIGPLFANTPEQAEALLAALAAGTGGARIQLDVPQANPEAVALAERLGLSAVFETARMYTGPAPELSLSRTYGITTFELG